MPRINRRQRRRIGALSEAQEMSLVIGTPGGFKTLTARREAWFANRDRLMPLVTPSQRPAAFWDYEGHERLVGEKSLAALARLGLLTDEEKGLIADSKF